MKATFRFPGSAEYSYGELETTQGSVGDVTRELRDVDDHFLNLMGDVLKRGCTLVALAPLNPTVIQDSGPDYGYQDPAASPQWASQAPQEAQGYSPAPQAYNAPQNAPQAYTGAYAGATQNSAQYNQNNVPTPPGQQAPICQYHQRPAKFKPAGTSTRTGKPYNAFWACDAGDNNCTKASNFPRP